MDYDQTDMAAAYDAGRGYKPEVLQDWLTRVSRSLQNDQVSRILDLGCGTGRFSAALAEQFDADVVALDPSEKMLAQALRKPHERVRLHRARGEALPLSDGSVDLVFMSMVFHHFHSPDLVARECRRVLRRHGSVCMRTGTVEQMPSYPYVPFFSESGSILRSDIPSRVAIESVFRQANLRLVHHELVVQELASCWNAYATRLSHRADSILTQLSDDDFESGLTLLEQYARSQPGDVPVTEPIDFFVFRESDASTAG